MMLQTTSLVHAAWFLSQQFNETKTTIPESRHTGSCSYMPYLCTNIMILRLPIFNIIMSCNTTKQLSASLVHAIQVARQVRNNPFRQLKQ